MGDIDQALARAFQRRGPAADAAPPAPHFAVDGPPMIAPAPPQAPAATRPVAFDPPAREAGAPRLGPVAVLDWPPTVRALERQHGHRFEELADALVAARESASVRSILFTSCHRSEGRTTLVLGLARALARRPGRTVLVDADLSGPMLARSLGLRPRLGLDDVLDGSASILDAVVEAPDDALAVLPLRAAPARPREALVGSAWATTLARLRRDFDHVLVDGGPLFAGLGAMPLPRAVDAAILVHNRKLTGDRAVLRAREALEAGGLPLLGLAETFV